MSRGRTSLVALLAVIIVATIAVVAAVMSNTELPIASPATPQPTSPVQVTATRSPSPTPIPTPTTDGTVAVLGDSFVVGLGGDSDYVSAMGAELGIATVGFGQTGTGFVNYGTGLPYDQRLALVLATQPVGLVVQASVNDLEISPDAVVIAASSLVDHARAIDKTLPIAIVGPIYLDTQSNPAMLAQREALKRFSATAKVTYIDPAGWITDATKPMLISADNVHPTSAGYQRIAAEMADALRPFAAELP